MQRSKKRPRAPRGRWPTRRRRGVIVLAVAFAAYLLGGFVGVPLVVRHVVVPRIGDRLTGNVTLDRARFNPLTLGLRLGGLDVTDAGGDTVIAFDRFEGNLELINTIFRSGYRFQAATLTSPRLTGHIAADGSINLVGLLRDEDLAAIPTDLGILAELPHLVLPELQIVDARLDARDSRPDDPFELTIENVHFVLVDVDTRPEHANTHRLTAATASGASIEWHGTVHLDPLTAAGELRIADFPLPQGMPYLTAHTNGQIVGGLLSATARYEFAPLAEPAVIRANVDTARLAQVAVEVDGRPYLTLTALDVENAVLDAGSRTLSVGGITTHATDMQVATDAGRFTGPITDLIDGVRYLLELTGEAWTVEISRLEVDGYTGTLHHDTLDPPLVAEVEVRRVAATDFVLATVERTITIGTLEVVDPVVDAVVPLLPSDDATVAIAEGTIPSALTEGAASYALSVESLHVQSAAISIRDERTEPTASVELAELDMTLTGIANDGATPATIVIDSRLQGTGHLTVDGVIDAFRTQPYADIEIAATDVPLTPYDPLAGPFVGYGIESGQATLTIPLKAESGTVDGEIDFAFDRLHLGDKVESKHAPDVPLKLGLDLMRDRNDRIEGTIPVEGDMSDPEFTLGGLVWKTVMDIPSKAAAAPFELIGSMFATGDDHVPDLSRIEFAPGSVELSETARQQLDVIKRAMHDRPALTLQVTGRYDPATDEPVLRERGLREEILARIQELNPVIPTVTEEAYRTWIPQLYEREIGPIENEAGERVRFGEMESTLRTKLEVSDNRKTGLAHGRGRAVVDWLVTDGLVPEARIRLIEPALGAATADTPRVDLSL